MPHEHHLYQYDCDAVLFDLDGVLVDSRRCIEETWRDWAVQHHLNPDKVLYYIHGRRAVETVRLAAPHLDAEREAAELIAIDSVNTTGLVKIPGALELVQSIPVDAWAIATSGPRVTATNRLTFCGLPIPAVLISSEDVVKGKPDPEPYLFAAMMLGAEPARCVVVEDAPAGIQAGRAAGMHVVGVMTGGYAPNDLSQAHVVVRKLSDIVVMQALGSQCRLIMRVKGI